jgi:hypothetical protein
MVLKGIDKFTINPILDGKSSFPGKSHEPLGKYSLPATNEKKVLFHFRPF